MKISILSILLTFCISSVANSEVTSKQEQYGRCKEMSNLAKTIMDNRQHNVPMSKQIDALLNLALNEDVKNISIEIVKLAYQISYYENANNKATAIREFENEIYSSCINEIK